MMKKSSRRHSVTHHYLRGLKAVHYKRKSHLMRRSRSFRSQPSMRPASRHIKCLKSSSTIATAKFGQAVWLSETQQIGTLHSRQKASTLLSLARTSTARSTIAKTQVLQFATRNLTHLWAKTNSKVAVEFSARITLKCTTTRKEFGFTTANIERVTETRMAIRFQRTEQSAVFSFRNRSKNLASVSFAYGWFSLSWLLLVM